MRSSVWPETWTSGPTRLGRRHALGAAALLGIVVGIGAWWEGLGLLSTLTNVFLFLLLTQAWNFLGGYAGYLNLAMAVFFGVGAYTTGILAYRWGWSPLLTFPLGGLMAVLWAAAVGVPSLRVRGPYFAVLTMILGFLAQVLAYNVPWTRGAMGIYVSPLPWDRRVVEQFFYFTYLGLALLVTGIAARIQSSRFGAALVAVREDEVAAGVLGVRTTWVKVAALLLGAFWAGVAGGLYTQRIGYIEPTGVFSLDISVDVVLMAMVGGAGTWQGPLLGVPLVMLVAELLRVGVVHLGLFGARIPAEFNRAVFGAALVLIALYAPQGLMGLVRPFRGRRLGV
ncbi:MAG: branched-chain amino acid ABC transporter permease [Armatimonadetes bacterium]|nr:branched-chain amino acid ABC transporter permease [Armatimonadota bacterium]MDW8152644.1 branched-chain amino acid ABC transporter permease [Armatimonadota bacterium]